jgi:ATP adenylyltransferase
LDRLFAPWRLEYVTATHPASVCVFCQAAGADPLVVFRGTCAYVILNRYPYNNGHLMVVPSRHVDTLIALSPEELQEVAVLTQRAEAVLREAYSPGGINVGLNLGKPSGGGINDHLHMHLVPRWVGDANFMTVIGETRVLPEELGVTAQRLKPIFERLALIT